MHNALLYLNAKNVDYIYSNVNRLREKIAKRSALEEVKKILSDDVTGDCYKVFYHNHDNTNSNIALDIQDPAGNSCLLFAIASQSFNVANILIEDAQNKLSIHEYKEFINYHYHNPLYPEKDSDSKAYYKNTALTLCTKYGKYELVKKLLDADADPNLGDEYNITPLSILCFQLGLVTEDKNPLILEIINLLKIKEVNFSQTDQTGLKPLDYLSHDLDGRDIRGYKIHPGIADKLLNLGYPYFGSEKELYTQITHDLIKNNYDTKHILIAPVLSKYYVQCINNAYTTDAKIYNSMHWGEKVVQKKIQDYYRGNQYPNVYYGYKAKTHEYKKDFFNTEDGQSLATNIYNIFDFASNSNLENYTLNNEQNEIRCEEVLELGSIGNYIES